MTVTRTYLPARTGQVHAYLAGAPTAKPSLVCLHQVPNSAQTFLPFLARMGEDRLAAGLDTPGFGMSDPVAGPERIAAYADALGDAIDALVPEGPIDLLGYHTGAAIAATLASRPGHRVRRLALVAIPVLTEEERAHSAALPPIPFDDEGEWIKAEWQRTRRWAGPGQDQASILRGFAEKLRPGARERGPQAICAFDLAPLLPRLAMPVLAVRPRDDLWEATSRARPLLPAAQWVELPEYGHGLFDAAPDLMADRLRAFLDVTG